MVPPIILSRPFFQEPVEYYRKLSAAARESLTPERNMKTLTRYLEFHVPERVGFENITKTVERLVSESNFQEALAPFDSSPARYHHNRTGEDNADAHMKHQLMGREAVIAITNGALDFGPWEQIFYGEFDGRRKKRVLVKIIGE